MSSSLTLISLFGRLAQLVRAPARHAGGHWFKSSIAHFSCYSPLIFVYFYHGIDADIFLIIPKKSFSGVNMRLGTNRSRFCGSLLLLFAALSACVNKLPPASPAPDAANPLINLQFSQQCDGVLLSWNIQTPSNFYQFWLVKNLHASSAHPGDGEIIYKGVAPEYLDKTVLVARPYYYTLFLQDQAGDFFQNKAGVTLVYNPDPEFCNGPIKDYNLFRCVKDALTTHSEWNVYEDITALSCVNRNISDLRGIEVLTHLESLEVSNPVTGNEIFRKVTDLTPLTTMSTLKNLILQGNAISDITPLLALTQLTDLQLQGNLLTTLPANLSGFSQLNRLYLYYNRLTTITSLAALTNLETLSLFSNQITDLSALSPLKQLKSLNIGLNPGITPASYGVIDAELVALNRLILNKNTLFPGLSSISSRLPQLKILHVTSCGLSDISLLSGAVLLEELSLMDNPISDISSLSSLSSLIHLRLSNTQIRALEGEDGLAPLQGLSALKELFLSNIQSSEYLYQNQISLVDSLSALSALITLDLSFNSITDVAPLGGLASIRYLYLQNNHIQNGILSLTTLPNLPYPERTYIYLNNNPQINCADLDELALALNDAYIAKPTHCGMESLASFSFPGPKALEKSFLHPAQFQ